MKTDAELVETIRAGATEPWGEVFDRWRDSVWHVALSVTRNHSDAEDVVQTTFLKAVESLGQLREPDKLRPWLCSIARSTALDRVRRRTETPSETASDAADNNVDLDSRLRQDEVADLVAAAFAGLEERDRTALELVEREELSGDELAQALGVSRDNAYALVHNARTRFARSVESVIVARAGGEACAELSEVLGRWEGQLTPLLRKRVARHIEHCETCAGTRDREVTRAALLNVLPLLAMPLVTSNGIRNSLLETAAAGATPMTTAGAGVAVTTTATKVIALVAGAAALVAVAVGAAVVIAGEGSEDRASAQTESSREVVGPEQIATVTARPAETATSAAVDEAAATPVATAGTDDPLDPSFCQITGGLAKTAAAGPASGSAGDIEAYMTETNGLLQQLARSERAGTALIAYSAAYQQLVDSEAWNLTPIPTDPELNALRDSVEAELAATCPAN